MKKRGRGRVEGRRGGERKRRKKKKARKEGGRKGDGQIYKLERKSVPEVMNIH